MSAPHFRLCNFIFFNAHTSPRLLSRAGLPWGWEQGEHERSCFTFEFCNTSSKLFQILQQKKGTTKQKEQRWREKKSNRMEDRYGERAPPPGVSVGLAVRARRRRAQPPAGAFPSPRARDMPTHATIPDPQHHTATCCCSGSNNSDAPSRIHPAMLLCSRAACKIPITPRSVSSSASSEGSSVDSSSNSSSRWGGGEAVVILISFLLPSHFPLSCSISRPSGGDAACGGRMSVASASCEATCACCRRATRSELRHAHVYSSTQRWLHQQTSN